MYTINITYALIMLAAVVTCAVLLRRSQHSLPLSPGQKFALGVGAFCGAMIGAKIPFLFSDWAGMLSGAAWLSNGKTIVFGIVGGYLGVEIAKWALDVQSKTGDTFAVPVATAVAIGRLGCFQCGCCYGTPTDLPWGIVFRVAGDNPPIPRHPTQLYEAAFHALAAMALVWLERRNAFRYQRLKLYLIGYLGYRFGSEWLRPEPILFGGLTGYQWAALALIALFAWLWWRDARLGTLPSSELVCPHSVRESIN